ncbi:exosortase H-associated membrane protein [Ottowia testudinis]|uniref:Uncharacterized protein n=1 Tax=Ottowia testudinis TaxID=2816950 RepID=A0A975CJ03_9BURK|nr:exosortase H-associated membrane protein [Ottowia testudinis]QTD46647.1 hypothetical protein J1M35_07170 [Ottowia testudinis]
MNPMRGTLIGRFLLLTIAALIVLLPLWYWAAPWLARPPVWIAGSAMQALFGWVKSFDIQEIHAILFTLVQTRMRGPAGDVLVQLASRVDYRVFGYGLPLLWAMLLASRPRLWWLKGAAGSLMLFVAQALGIASQWMMDVVVTSGPTGSAYLAYPRWVANAILYSRQFNLLMLTPMLPVLLWLLFNKPFVAALWLEAALDESPEGRARAPTIDAGNS